ncbi:xanthine dehydrogenase small subunit [Marinimicrobium agarilyticum]|uniref:xanthine dehydrogenase small subunit n=1 Tax=Marinimicrobium agarilyticum TaxID=306546 RepID=UPI00041546B6|nr:xanthine dehydrogenase small subunit [Marinimicrobium agarilyticum]
MRLVVNKVSVETGPQAPEMTLLRFLREQRRLTGTKEGCASGDCGACTVMVVEQGPDGPISRTVNSCICPLGSVAGQEVVTVEGLASDGELHPVQEAMVNCHGSQCGFCTPGFVMSLASLHSEQAALLEADDGERRHRILDAISGNLCRCTGYRPIVEAGFQALKKPAQLANIVQEQGEGAPFASNETASEAGNGYYRPATEEALQQCLRDQPTARLIAGGTDLMLEATQLYRTFDVLIDLNAIGSLKQVSVTSEHIAVGAAVTYTELERTLGARCSELMQMLNRLGSRQIRNRGTVGGNIGNASPIADMPPYLLVLEAELIIRNSRGKERRERLIDFYRGYKQTTLGAGEYLAEVVFDRAAFEEPLKLIKLSKRYEDDISAVMGAFRWRADGSLAIAYGGMAATPKRALETEALLNRSIWQREGELDQVVLDLACEQLAREFTPMTDVRASADYRMAMAGTLLRKACRALVAERVGKATEPGVFSHA